MRSVPSRLPQPLPHRLLLGNYRSQEAPRRPGGQGLSNMRVVRAGWGRLGAAVRTWALAVAPRGRVAVRLPGPVRVRPLDPLRPLGAERVLVRARGGGLHVLYDEARREVAIAAGGGGAVDVTAPACFGACGARAGSGSPRSARCLGKRASLAGLSQGHISLRAAVPSLLYASQHIYYNYFFFI